MRRSRLLGVTCQTVFRSLTHMHVLLSIVRRNQKAPRMDLTKYDLGPLQMRTSHARKEVYRLA